jgi:hypothetical protein
MAALLGPTLGSGRAGAEKTRAARAALHAIARRPLRGTTGAILPPPCLALFTTCLAAAGTFSGWACVPQRVALAERIRPTPGVPPALRRAPRRFAARRTSALR